MGIKISSISGGGGSPYAYAVDEPLQLGLDYLTYKSIIHQPAIVETGPLDDLTSSGTFTGSFSPGINAKAYAIVIASEGTPDTFVWRRFDSSIYSAPIAITGGAQEIEDGVFITFAATTGHTSGSAWSLIVDKGIHMDGLLHVQDSLYVENSFGINANKDFILGKAILKFNKETHDPIYLGISGLDDLEAQGIYNQLGNTYFELQIDAVGTPDTFQWRKTEGGAWTTGVSITGAWQDLENDIQIKFTATTGHTLNDSWRINSGSALHINNAPLHIVGQDLIVDGEIVAEGSISSYSPAKFSDGLMFINSETKARQMHQFVAGVNTEYTPIVPSSFHGTTIFKQYIDNVNEMHYTMWCSHHNRPMFTVSKMADGRANVFESSLLIGVSKGTKTLDNDYNKPGSLYSNLICETDSDGAELGVEGNVEFLKNLYVKGDLHVTGTSYQTSSEVVNIADNHLYLNSDYEVVAAQTGGLVINYLPTATNDTVSAGAFVAGVASTSNPTVATVGAAVFAVGDFIQINGTSSSENNGLFEVLSHAANVLTIRGIGITGTVEDFTQNQFVANASDNATIVKVNVSVLRSNGSGLWETGIGSSTTLSFKNIGIKDEDTILLKSVGVELFNAGYLKTNLLADDGIRIEIDEVRARDADGLKLYDDGGVGIFIADGGNVGIGTSGSSAKLHIAADAEILRLSNLTTTSFAGIRFYENATPNGFIQAIGSNFSEAERRNALELGGNDKIGFFVNSDEKLTIDLSGNVGIGTLSPDEQLELTGRLHLGQTAAPGVTTDKLYNVAGSLYWNGIVLTASGYWTQTGSDIYYNIGNVGLGITDPDEQLEMTGRLHLGATSAPGVTTNKLYNVGGSLYWDGTDLTVQGAAEENCLLGLSSDQTNINANTLINLIISENYGVTFSNVTHQATLTANKTYELRAFIRHFGNGVGQTATYRWYNYTTSSWIGTVAVAGALNTDADDGALPIASVSIKPGVSTNVGLRCVNISSANQGIRGDSTCASIKVISDATFIQMYTGATSIVDGKPGYIPAPTAGQEDTFLSGDGSWRSPGAFLEENCLLGLSIDQGSINIGSTVDFIGSYCVGISFSNTTHRAILKANKTYELKADLRHYGNGGGTGANYMWYDFTNSSFIGATALVGSANTSSDDGFQTVANALIKPSTDIEVELRCTNVTAVNQGLRGDSTQAIIKCISSNVGIVSYAGATALADGGHGYVPAPLAGDDGKYLCGNGTWKDLHWIKTGNDIYYNAGNVVIGATSTTANFQVSNSGGDCQLNIWASTADDDAILMFGTETGQNYYLTLDDSDGCSFKIGPTKASSHFVLAQSGYINIPGVYAETDASSANVFVASDGSLRRSTSSRKIKENIEYDNIDFDIALQFKPVTFRAKSNGESHIGFIAEDMRDIDKRFASDGGEENLPGLNLNAIMASLTALVQKQQKQIEELKAA